MKKGRFITIEGSEGVGKSTQIEAIKRFAAQRGIDALFTREPGGTTLGEKIRQLLMSIESGEIDPTAELLLYNAARAQHMREVILPALDLGKTVFCDRFFDSTLAYQGYGRGVDLDIVRKVNAIGALDTTPCLTLFLDLSPRLGFLRKGGVDKRDRIESSGESFFGRVYEGFLSIDEPRFVKIDANADKDTVSERVFEVLKKFLGLNQ